MTDWEWRLKKAPLKRFGELNLPLTDAEISQASSCERKENNTGRISLCPLVTLFHIRKMAEK